MLNGLIKPDTGRIEMRGRVGAVIALGAGFNPVLSGRENIYVNASVMGLPQDEINSRFDEIVAFAELDEFIDMPVQSYSSGMQVRLGFAVATALKPDVLILDEVLAVGDARFRSKCYKKIDELVNDAAVIFVSHNMDQIARLCSKALCLKRGVGHETKDLSAAVLGYENDGTLDLSESRSFVSANQAVENFSFRVNSKSHSPGASLDLEISCRTEISLNDLKLRIVLYNSYGLMCADSGFVPALSLEPHHLGGETVFLVSVPWIPLKPGSYTISVNMTGSKGQLALWAHKVSEFMVSGVFSGAFTDCLLSLEPAPSSGDAPGIRKDEPFTDCRKPLLSRGAAG
jgi:lipopolysaccharide transport system ATP-binding protein